MTLRAPTGVGARCRAVIALAAAGLGCSDLGSGTTGDDGGPRIDELLPARTVLGDSVRVQGRGFGAVPGDATFEFTTPSAGPAGRSAEVLSWSDTEILVLVPADAIAGPTTFERDGTNLDGPSFDVAPRRVTYSGDVVPILETNGCTTCHGGEGGLDVRPWSSLMRGNSVHGPVVVPRSSGRSLLVQRLLPETPLSQRMPQDASPLAPATILVVADWIDQGARND